MPPCMKNQRFCYALQIPYRWTEAIWGFSPRMVGKDLAELFASGREKLASVPSGGGGAVAYSAPTGGVAAAAESKKEEKVGEKEESDDDMGFNLFD
ncbi:hypothetical protein G4B88_015995 [Cannabis sativa]|uniref:Uncharacterized protein n=1 Tax=Cannabis sativa TaxID=3483 RepID=A0A7J6DMF8_CANSA|nr:hypothetical protein G4B88_015995 [Cannabis sativa]